MMIYAHFFNRKYELKTVWTKDSTSQDISRFMLNIVDFEFGIFLP